MKYTDITDAHAECFDLYFNVLEEIERKRRWGGCTLLAAPFYVVESILNMRMRNNEGKASFSEGTITRVTREEADRLIALFTADMQLSDNPSDKERTFCKMTEREYDAVRYNGAIDGANTLLEILGTHHVQE